MNNNIKKWLTNYLRGREQRTEFDNLLSKSAEVRTGVPQGSVISTHSLSLVHEWFPQGSPRRHHDNQPRPKNRRSGNENRQLLERSGNMSGEKKNNLYSTQPNVKIWSSQDDKCRFCNKETETVNHIFQCKIKEDGKILWGDPELGAKKTRFLWWAYNNNTQTTSPEILLQLLGNLFHK